MKNSALGITLACVSTLAAPYRLPGRFNTCHSSCIFCSPVRVSSACSVAYMRWNTGSEKPTWQPWPQMNGRYASSRSFGRHPIWNVSSVTTNTLNPFALARASSEAVNASACGFGQYSWNHRSPSPLACATCSMLRVAAVDRIIGTLAARAARAVASSASSCTISCTPIGAISNGLLYVFPNSSVDRSRRVACTNMLGRRRYRSNADRLAACVLSLLAAPNT